MKSATLDVIAGLNPEGEQPEERKFQVEKDKALEELVDVFTELFYDPLPLGYNEILPLTPEKVAAEHITKLALLVRPTELNADFLGTYLAALINKSADTHHVLHLQSQPEPLYFIGYKLPEGKRLTVYGNVGWHFGDGNQGELALNGSAQEFLGMDNWGKITVYGNGGNTLGIRNAGLIIVNGNAGSIWGANRGEIHLNGDYVWITKRPCVLDGKIYHRGKLIAGEKV